MKFAHLADIHLGFQKKESLQSMERKVFEAALDDCISRKVDFILICGDMFHSNIPNMNVQKFAFAKFRQVYEAGIPVYVVYGSHDSSPNSTSVIDLLVETGYIIKVQKTSQTSEDGSISLDFVTNKKTGVKLTGLPGLPASREIEYYENLDRQSLESEPGFKIFLFHGALAEMGPAEAKGQDVAKWGDSMPISYLPRGFDYYAGGHMHKYVHRSMDGYSNVVYPGTPFAGYPSDLEDNARGIKRGYVLVETDNSVAGGVYPDASTANTSAPLRVQFIDVPNYQYELLKIDANNKSSSMVYSEIDKRIDAVDPDGNMVILKVNGTMSEGKTTDIDFDKITETLLQNNAIAVEINRNSLSSAEYKIVESKGETNEEIALNTFAENIGGFKSPLGELMGQKGAELAQKLLQSLSMPSLQNESLAVYTERITGDALRIMRIDDDDSDGDDDSDSDGDDDSDNGGGSDGDDDNYKKELWNKGGEKG